VALVQFDAVIENVSRCFGGDVIMKLTEMLGRLRHGDVELPTLVRVPDDHVLADGYTAEPFEAGRHYFTVRMNTMCLQHGRHWLTTWHPMLISVIEFRYGGQEVSVPFVVGPSMLKQRTDAEIPLATVFAGTEVVGVHPYAGDRVSVTMLLYRVKHDDYVRRVLGVVEKMAAAFDYSTVLTQYLKIAGAVVDGIDAILGVQDTTPVLGYRTEYNPNAGDIFRPGYFALLTGTPPDPESLWVRDHMVRTGGDAKSAQPIGEDVVLYSVTGTVERNDIPSLPWFRPLWERVSRAANTGTPEAKQATKAHLGFLYENLQLSDDVARKQVQAVYDEYDTLARKIFEVAKKRDTWGPEDLAKAEDDLQRKFLEILTD
jgi:hypothetical protein